MNNYSAALCAEKRNDRLNKKNSATGLKIAILFPSVPVLYIGSFLIGTSNTLVLPQTMGSVVTADHDQSTMLMASCLAIANVGMFLAPAVTRITGAVMGNDLSSSRFLFTGILAAVFAGISFLVLSRLGKRQENGRIINLK